MQSKRSGRVRGGGLIALACGLALPTAALACPPGEEEESFFVPSAVELKLIDAGKQDGVHKEHVRLIMVTPDHEVKVLGDGGDFDVFIDGDPAGDAQVVSVDGGLKVLDAEGNLITFVHMHPGGAMGVSSAPPSPIADARLLRPGQAPRGFSFSTDARVDVADGGPKPRVMLGITMTDVPEELAKKMGLETESAILLSKVSPGLPAGKAGMKANDVIVSIDGKKPATRELLTKVLLERDPGDRLPLVVKRGSGGFVEIEVELEAFDGERLRGSLNMGGTAGGGTARAPRAELLVREQANAALRNKLATMSTRAAELAAAQASASGEEAARLADEMAMVSKSMAELASELAIASARSGGQSFFTWRGPGGGGAGGESPFGGIIEFEDEGGERFFVTPEHGDEEMEIIVERLAEAYERSMDERRSMAEHIERALEAQREPLAHLGEHQEQLVDRLREIEERIGDTNRWRHELAPRVEEHTEHMMERLEEIEERMDRIEDRLDERLSNLERMLEKALRERERH